MATFGCEQIAEQTATLMHANLEEKRSWQQPHHEPTATAHVLALQANNCSQHAFLWHVLIACHHAAGPARVCPTSEHTSQAKKETAALAHRPGKQSTGVAACPAAVDKTLLRQGHQLLFMTHILVGAGFNLLITKRRHLPIAQLKTQRSCQ